MPPNLVERRLQRPNVDGILTLAAPFSTLGHVADAFAATELLEAAGGGVLRPYAVVTARRPSERGTCHAVLFQPTDAVDALVGSAYTPAGTRFAFVAMEGDPPAITRRFSMPGSLTAEEARRMAIERTGWLLGAPLDADVAFRTFQRAVAERVDQAFTCRTGLSLALPRLPRPLEATPVLCESTAGPLLSQPPMPVEPQDAFAVPLALTGYSIDLALHAAALRLLR